MAEETGILQSMRSSCDRCRFHKLRCFRSAAAVSDASNSRSPTPCERCMRAQAPCIFGRRRLTNKRISTASVPPTATATPTEPAQDSNQTENQGLSSLPSQNHLPTPISPATLLPGPSTQLWENENITIGIEDTPGQQNDMNCWDLLHPDFNLHEGINFDSDISSWFSVPLMTDPSPDIVTVTHEPLSINEPISVVHTEQIITLIAKMQQFVQTLEQGRWKNSSEQDNLDDYPVGTILHLSQEFGSIADAALPKMTPGKNISATETPTNRRINSTKGIVMDRTNDTVTTILVLSGYMSLESIYRLVLSQFQIYLSNVPSDRYSNRVQNTTTTPSLRLGELPCTSTAPVLGKIHTALCMLLSALNGVEEKLGQGGSVARSLAVALLAQESVLGTSHVHGGLSRKMESMKEVLQEKMSL